MIMRNILGFAGAAIAAVLFTTPAAAIKKLPYTEVKVDLSDVHQPDAAFKTMRKAFADAVSKKAATALFALVGPTFIWTVAGGNTDQFDQGRDALHNFKVLFGFREAGKSEDGGVQDGPYWDSLASFVPDSLGFFETADATNLVCSPMLASIADEKIQEAAEKKLGTDDDPVEWNVVITETAVAKTPGDTGPPVAKINKVAVPVLANHPPSPQNGPAVTPTHIEILLPTGRSGWIPASAAIPLFSDRLCFSKTASGDWKISGFDQDSDE
jgi:hypothetical protein